jgi:hypothetical protein
MTIPHLHSTALSASDAKILNTVFDPESAPEAPSIAIDARLPQDPHITDTALLSALRDEELAAIKLIEGYSGSEKHIIYLQALEILNDIVTRNPLYASAWNNRAQLRRWRYGDRGVLTSASTVPSEEALEAKDAIVAALNDLDTAISLATPPNLKDAAVSPAQGRLLAQAWTQRAAILWGAAKDLGMRGMTLNPSSDGDVEYLHWDRTRFEEEGSRCFFVAGLYGSEVGRAMAVLSNPTAKLCGSIVKEAMRRERCGA